MAAISLTLTPVLTLALLAAPAFAAAAASPTVPFNDPPVAHDDAYAATSGNNLSVDAPGVLENDTDTENDPLTAILVDSSGASGVLFLFDDGSFEYEPAPGFVGTDVFVYKANDGADSNLASVTFTVSGGTGGGPVAYTNETSFLAALAGAGLTPVAEGFEDGTAWGPARYPTTVPSITSQGLTWTSNNATSLITTGPGPALDGAWGFFCLPHGNYTAGPQCATPGVCTDGWIVTARQPLTAFGGFVRNNGAPGGLVLWLDGDTANPVGFGGVAVSGWQFFGVIAPDGFTSIEFHETEGKAEDQVIIFGDRFTFAWAGGPPIDPWTDLGNGLAGTAGVPVLAGTGTLQAGTPMSLLLASARPSAAFTLVVGAFAIDAPFKGGVLVPQPTLLVSGLVTDGAGAHVLGATWPAGVPAGFSFYFQDWVVDPVGVAGLAASNGLRGTTP